MKTRTEINYLVVGEKGKPERKQIKIDHLLHLEINGIKISTNSIGIHLNSDQQLVVEPVASNAVNVSSKTY